MGLYPDAEKRLRSNLELAARSFALERAARPRQPIVRIGQLSAAQLTKINQQRQEEELPPVVSEVLFDGRHMYASRCMENGYSIDDVIEMVLFAFNDDAQVAPGWSTVLRSATTRVNKTGKTIRDEAVFECHGRLPHPELHSVVPRGGRQRPYQKEEGRPLKGGLPIKSSRIARVAW
jgi:hypothetical protein